jgi:penicillin-binding protein 2
MYPSKRQLSSTYIKKAANIAAIILISIFLGIFIAFWNIQVVNYEYFRRLAIQNITRSIDLMAPRGLIVDSQRVILSENKINFTLYLVRENVVDIEKTMRLASFFSAKKTDAIRNIIARYKKYPQFYRIPIKNNLALGTVIFIESRQEEFPEFVIGIEPTRTYPLDHCASNVLGYISEITEAELSSKKGKGYALGDFIGRSGIEKQYEPYLQGVKGSQIVIKDNLEKIQKVQSEIKPVIGATVVLTLNLELQKLIEGLFVSQNGAVGVVDLQTGGILAMVSKPDFNPEIFSQEMEKEQWLALSSDPQKPLQNKFLQGIYSPGSVFKIIIALAGLQEKIITPATVVHCSGSQDFYGREFHCWNLNGHGDMNIFSALQNSCNIFFYNLGKRLDIDTIARYARMMGLGSESGIDMPNENTGLVPSSAWKMQTYKQRWFPGETISVAIGHGSLNVTPVQLLKMIATVALRGRMPRLHLLQRIERDGKIVAEFTPEFTQVPIAAENFQVVVEGLFRVVNNGGTGKTAAIAGLDICGKTGTSQIIAKDNPNYNTLTKEKRFMPNSWFVSFAPKDNPRLAIAVLVENGGDAGAIAAPLAARIYKKYFENERLF